ncbi:MAG: hypothetical protein ACYSX0_10355, partial [Planctomycetota bacterium]
MREWRMRPAGAALLLIVLCACGLTGCKATWQVPMPLDPATNKEFWPFVKEVWPGTEAYEPLREIRDAAFDALKSDPPPNGPELDAILHAIEQCFECYGPDWLDARALDEHAGKVKTAHDLMLSEPVDWQAIGDTLKPEFPSTPAGTTERWPFLVAIEPGVPASAGLRVIRNKAIDALKAAPDP